MENIHEPQHGGSNLVDPLSHLALLNRSKNAPAVESFFHFGPWWYAPLCANVLAGLSLWGGVVETTFVTPSEVIVRPAAIAVAAVSAAALALHGIRNDRVKVKADGTSVLLTVVALIVLWSVIAAWSSAISAIGWDQITAQQVIIGWLLTSGFFLALRSGLHRVRDSRRVAVA